jgi:hypothetical protein
MLRTLAITNIPAVEEVEKISGQFFAPYLQGKSERGLSAARARIISEQ